MASHPSRDELERELRRRRLPQAYIARLLAELDDHYEDLLEERSTSMGAARKLQIDQHETSPDELQQRLGQPTQLAAFAAEQYHARSFWGRHPLVTFGFAPLPLLAAGWTAAVLGVFWACMGIGYVCEHWFGLSDEMSRPQDHLLAQAIVTACASWLIMVFPPLTVAALLCRVARRNALSWRWPIAACILMSLVAGLLFVKYRLALAPNNGQLMIGFNCEGSARAILLTYLPKFAVALGIGLLLVKRAQRQLELEA
jgi:hypothetical protein